MLFQEIMRLEPFEGATVLVGDTRGEHQVKAVYVSDGSNIPEKAERGGAFFVCDTAFGDKNNKEFDDNLKKYIDCLTDKQAAGLIIEKHTEMAEITEDIVSYAAFTSSNFSSLIKASILIIIQYYLFSAHCFYAYQFRT